MILLDMLRDSKLKFLILLIVIQLYNSCNVYVSANSDAFLNNISELGVPRYNMFGEEINEDLYIAYNEYVYGSPTEIVSGQRWKDLYNGSWTKNGSRYIGYGTRGEYAILGYNYSGNLVYNYYFPLDGIVVTPVKQWIFLNLPDAYESWERMEYTKSQLDYAKVALWWFFDLENSNYNPYNQVCYNINAISVGLNKARLETASTWKSQGTIYVERRTELGNIAWANFTIEPMAANADVKSRLNIDSNYVLKQTEDYIYIIIKYGAYIENMTEYASPNDIKELKAQILLNGVYIDEISGSKTTNIGKEYLFVVSRNEYVECKKYTFEIEIISTAKTQFVLDGILKDSIKKTFTIDVTPKQIFLKNSELKNINVEKSQLVVSPLAQTIETVKSNSLGFSEGGRKILYLVYVNNLKGNINNISISIDEKNMDYDLLNMTFNSYIYIVIDLPLDLKTTLYGYKSLREKYNNYFEINQNEMLSRKSKPHELKITFYSDNVNYEDIVYFDTLDDILSNINLDVRNKIVNLNEIKFEELEGIKI